MKLKLNTWPRRFGAALILILILAGCGAPLAGESWAGLSTDGKYVYVAYKEQVFRIDTTPDPSDPTHRHIQWFSQATNKPHFYAPPAVSDSGVYVGAFDDKVYAFNRDKGGALATWTIPVTTDKITGSATVAGNMVYVGMGNNGIRAYDAQTGQEKARYDGTKFGVWAAPLVQGDTVYFTSLDHHLYALNAGTLTYKWQVDLGGASAEQPVYDNGILYIGTFGGQVLAIDTTGAAPCVNKTPCIVRHFNTINSGWVWGRPVLDNGVLYFGDLNGMVYAIDAATFTQKWTATDKDNGGGIRGSVAIVSGVKTLNKSEASTLVIVGSESKRVYAYDARDGSVVWVSGVMNDKILSNMVIVGSGRDLYDARRKPISGSDQSGKRTARLADQPGTRSGAFLANVGTLNLSPFTGSDFKTRVGSLPL